MGTSSKLEGHWCNEKEQVIEEQRNCNHFTQLLLTGLGRTCVSGLHGLHKKSTVT